MRYRRTLPGVTLALAVGALSVAPRFSHADPPASPAPASVAPARSGGLPIQAPTLPLERYVLPNGLEVILHEDHRAPLASVNIWYHVGGKDEPAGRNGFAHLFEHLMFQGSRHVPEDTFFLNLERVGASGINGTTGDDRTNYFETVPAGRLNLALWLESDRMAFLLDHVDQATFESQRRVVLNERRQNYENAPYGNVYRLLREAMYPPTHPYYRLPIGTPEDLNAATLDDVRNFFRTWYLPNNATLVITGDFDPAATRALVEQYFAPIARGGDVPRRADPAPIALTHETRVAVEAGVELPRVYLSWPTPPYFAPGDGELDLVANVLTTGRSSRLYRRLVHEMQIAQDVEAGQSSMQLASTFDIVVTARPGHTPEEILAVVDEELARLRREPPTEDELLRARTDVLTSIVFDLERVGARADRLNRYAQYVHDPNYLANDLGRYQHATAADLQQTAVRYLPPDRRTVLMVYPTPGAPLAGRIRGSAPAASTPTGGAR